MIKILEGPLRDVEKLANTMEAEGWCPLGPAVPNGRNPVTNAQMVMLTMVKQMAASAQMSDKQMMQALGYTLNSVGGGDE